MPPKRAVVSPLYVNSPALDVIALGESGIAIGAGRAGSMGVVRSPGALGQVARHTDLYGLRVEAGAVTEELGAARLVIVERAEDVAAVRSEGRLVLGVPVPGCVTGVISNRTTEEQITPESLRKGEDHAVQVGIKAIELLIRSPSTK